MTDRLNRQWHLVSRPKDDPTPDNFALVTEPVLPPREGQVLARTLYASVDPYMRGRMSERASYAEPHKLNRVMQAGTVGQVVESRAADFSVGDIIVGYGGWQELALYRTDLTGQAQTYKVPDRSLPLSIALGAAGMPGITAYFGVTKLARPTAGETLVVSAASGAVGSVVGQLAKMHGCRVVGVAGGEKKCSLCVDDLGFDACVDYKAPGDLGERLRAACPDGIDIYFENVGGAVVEAVAPLLNPGSRAPICGFISQYSAAEPVIPSMVLAKSPNPPESRFFLVGEWPDEYVAAARKLTEWIKSGELRVVEDVVEGFESLPQAFIGMLRGENVGKRVVHVADPE